MLIQRNEGQNVRKILTTAAMLVAAFAGITSTASAAGQFTDGFEGNPWSRWEGVTFGDGVAGADINQGLARSGQNDGWLRSDLGWAAERVAVQVGSWGARGNCTASVFAEPVGRDAQVELQIWNPNGWQLLSTNAPVLARDRYQAITTGPVSLAGTDTVYLQAIFHAKNGQQFVRLDDASLTCF